MRLAISNIAWTPAEDDAVGEAMRREGAAAVEIAPTLYWPDPLAASAAEVDACREAWARRGFPVAALQSLLFGQPHLQLFGDTSDEMARRLEGMAGLAARLGAPVMVFGSPKNRLRGSLSPAQALERAVPFFRRLGEAAARRGVALCLEPNPPQYGCDFVTTAAEGRELVERVGSPGFGLHLDLAGMRLAGEDGPAELGRSLPWLRHVHFSAPGLGQVLPGAADYRAAAEALSAGGYQGFVSVEMRAEGDAAARVARVAETLRFVHALAGDGA